MIRRTVSVLLGALVFCAADSAAQATAPGGAVPDLTALVARPGSELALVVDRFNTDLGSVRALRVSLNFIGDGLRDALDPRLRT